VLTSAWTNVTFTADPLPATLKASAEDAIAVGLLDAGKVEKAGGLPGTLYDLTLLNKALAAAGEPRSLPRELDNDHPFRRGGGA